MLQSEQLVAASALTATPVVVSVAPTHLGVAVISLGEAQPSPPPAFCASWPRPAHYRAAWRGGGALVFAVCCSYPTLSSWQPCSHKSVHCIRVSVKYCQ
ncbi:hypothetical protein PF007_g5188 [Phytophthora fragariae]|uniref:Uncharacterized protein n=1 Tax=Phytophthora fragariae TaxID=53985 RepID=A0A6A4E6C1_9STRA|nr:hypothetical protein PF003_g39131 [Phytophthora fragariae]KAE8932411.1 hypothetical protein PF009_g17562 [Phytophthora fragariae]KAE9105215.1 hypothetical protein PF006_g21701 [Phytophthora fragariae]KAE9128657.1 hypothetical protein PF007_g5188 [Phytophthora fragariae]KAE9320566.1 hypothetical protein PF001_g5355 [Phytophthora fragariae]